MKHMLVILSLILACAGCAADLSQMPADASAAFSLPDYPRRNTTLTETVTVQASLNDGLKAAEEAFVSVGFEARPESWTRDRRCAEYTIGWHEWPFWACMYLQPAENGMLRNRIIVEGWNSFGVKTSQPWHIHLATAFQNRLKLKPPTPPTAESSPQSPR